MVLEASIDMSIDDNHVDYDDDNDDDNDDNDDILVNKPNLTLPYLTQQVRPDLPAGEAAGLGLHTLPQGGHN